MRAAPVILAIFAAASLSGCATEPVPSPARARADRPPVVIRPLFAADYMATASSIDLYEIRAAEMAMSRAADPKHRDYARTMIADHKGTSAQLSLAGRRLNLLPRSA